MKVQFQLAALSMAAVIGLAGCGSSQEETEPAAATAQALTAVETQTATAEEIGNDSTYSGTVAPNETVSVFSQVSGMVAQVNYDVGDQVEKGDVLFQMDTESIRNNIAQLQASYESALANVKVAQTSLDTVNGAQTQIQIESLKTALDNAQMALDTAKTTYENTKVLFEQGFVSQTDMTAAEDAYKNAQNAYDQAKSSYDLTSGQMIEENTQKAQASLEAAQAQANAVQAQIASAQKSLRDATVTSPISGVVTACNVTAGTLMSSAQAPFTIEDTSVMKVDINVSEETVNQIALGDTVSVKVDASAGEDMTGTVTLIHPASNAAGMYSVEISLDNAAGDLKTGMFAEVSLIKEEGGDAIVLPRDAILTTGDENYVYIEEDGKAVRTPVTLGIDTGTQVQVLTGLTEGDAVIVSGQNYVEDGQEVRLVARDGEATQTAATEPSENAAASADASETDAKEE